MSASWAGYLARGVAGTGGGAKRKHDDGVTAAAAAGAAAEAGGAAGKTKSELRLERKRARMSPAAQRRIHYRQLLQECSATSDADRAVGAYHAMTGE